MDLKFGKFSSNAGLLGWALVLALVMSLILLGAMVAATYVADEFCSPSSSGASCPPLRPGGP